MKMNLQEIPKSTVNLVINFPNELTNRIIKMALAAIQPCPQDLSKPIDKLSKDKNIPKDQMYDVLSVYIGILKLFATTNDKDLTNLLLEIGFSNDFVQNLPFRSNRKELTDTYFNQSYGNFQNVSSVKWKIDISLSLSVLLSKTVPNIILCIKLKNGKSFTVQLNPKTFHKLRFNIALILKEMTRLRANQTKMVK